MSLAYFKIRNKYGLEKNDRDLLRLYIDEYLQIWLTGKCIYAITLHT